MKGLKEIYRWLLLLRPTQDKDEDVIRLEDPFLCY